MELLLVEDDRVLGDALERGLREAGHVCVLDLPPGIRTALANSPGKKHHGAALSEKPQRRTTA